MTRAVLIAGIGNVFFADDGFGVLVARALGAEAWPPGTRVIDFGIRGLHLAYELLDPPDLLVLVDATQRGGPPGTLYVIDPFSDAQPDAGYARPDPHGMSVQQAFDTLCLLGGSPPTTRIVAVEACDLSEGMQLSAPVANALAPALELVRRLATDALAS